MSMGNWKKQMETMKKKKDKDKNSKDVLGKFFFDLAKLVFTAMVLVAAVSLIIDETSSRNWLLLSSGLIATYTFACMGYNILEK